MHFAYIVLFLVLPLLAAGKPNITHFGNGASSGKRTLTIAAFERRQWLVKVKCSLVMDEIMQVYNSVQASYELSQMLSTSESLTNPDAIPCSVTLAGQGILSTLLVIQCDDSSTLNGIKLQSLLSNVDLNIIPRDCQLDLSVHRDPGVTLKNTMVETQQTQAVSGIWNLDRIDQRNRPNNNAYTYVRTGTGVKVYILDTGGRLDHVENTGRASLAANYAEDGIDTDCNGLICNLSWIHLFSHYL